MEIFKRYTIYKQKEPTYIFFQFLKYRKWKFFYAQIAFIFFSVNSLKNCEKFARILLKNFEDKIC